MKIKILRDFHYTSIGSSEDRKVTKGNILESTTMGIDEKVIAKWARRGWVSEVADDR